jgi:hypothetical protein
MFTLLIATKYVVPYSREEATSDVVPAAGKAWLQYTSGPKDFVGVASDWVPVSSSSHKMTLAVELPLYTSSSG